MRSCPTCFLDCSKSSHHCRVCKLPSHAIEECNFLKNPVEEYGSEVLCENCFKTQNSLLPKNLEPITSNTRLTDFFNYESSPKVSKTSSNPEPFTLITPKLTNKTPEITSFLTAETPEVKCSRKILTCFDKIRCEKTRSIDLSDHFKSILYCQKLSSDLLLENLDSKNVHLIKNELNLYFERVESLASSKLPLENSAKLFNEKFSSEFKDLSDRLSSITSARIVSSHLNQTSPSVDSNCPRKYQNVSITDIEATFDIGEHVESITSFERRKDLCRIQHLSHIGKTKPVSYKKAKGGKVDARSISEAQMNLCKSWLVLSPSKKGYYCLQCALIFNGRNNDREKFKNVKFGLLVEKPLVNFNQVTGKKGILDIHSGTQYHKYAVSCYNSLRLGLTLEDVSSKFDPVQPSKNSNARQALKKIIEVVYTCCTNNLALRGHRDSGKVEGFGTTLRHSANGNFKGILSLLSDPGHPLEKFLKVAPDSA